jgi:serine/threonine-protein kinase
VILYEALTGRLPVESDHIGDLIILIAAGGAPTVAAVRPELGEALSEVARKAMSVMVDARYDDARAMRTALLDARDRTDAAALALPAKSRRRRSGLPPKPAETADTVGAKGATEAAAALAKTLPARRAPEAELSPPAHSVETPKAWTVSEQREPGGGNRTMLIALAGAVAIAAGAFAWSSRGDGNDTPRERPDRSSTPSTAAATPPVEPDPIALAADAGVAVVAPAPFADAGSVAPEPAASGAGERAFEPARATRGTSSMRASRPRPAMNEAPPATLRDLDY